MIIYKVVTFPLTDGGLHALAQSDCFLSLLSVTAQTGLQPKSFPFLAPPSYSPTSGVWPFPHSFGSCFARPHHHCLHQNDALFMQYPTQNMHPTTMLALQRRRKWHACGLESEGEEPGCTLSPPRRPVAARDGELPLLSLPCRSESFPPHPILQTPTALALPQLDLERM